MSLRDLIPTIIIAAPDSSPEMRAVADYLTTGSGDSAIFAAAVEALPSGGVLYPRGTFDFTEENICDRNCSVSHS